MHPSRDEYDEEMGTLNPRPFYRRFAEFINSAQSTGGSFAFGIVNYDSYLELDDSVSDETYQMIQIELAKRLLNVLWPDDVVGSYGFAEYMVLLAGADVRRAGCAAGKIRRTMRRPMHFEDVTLIPDIVMGVAVYPDHGTTEKELMHRESEDYLRDMREIGL